MLGALKGCSVFVSAGSPVPLDFMYPPVTAVLPAREGPTHRLSVLPLRPLALHVQKGPRLWLALPHLVTAGPLSMPRPLLELLGKNVDHLANHMDLASL